MLTTITRKKNTRPRLQRSPFFLSGLVKTYDCARSSSAMSGENVCVLLVVVLDTAH